MEWTVDQIVEITGGRLVRGEKNTVIRKFGTDSRNVEPESFFVPLKGPRFDGHQFIEKACRAGSIGFFKAPGIETEGQGICIEVEDPLTALQKVALDVRKRFKGPVIAVTGSNGKTTTKEMLYAIFRDKTPLLKTEGNLNNHIGLPLTLLRLKSEHQLILLEMGINHAGELRALCEIARPTLGLITNIGETHLEGLGSLEGVAKAKGEMLDFLEEGTAVLNWDSPFFASLKSRQKGKVISFGLAEGADIRGMDLESKPEGISFKLVHQTRRYPVQLLVSGMHNVSNALGAAAAALALGFSLEDVVRGLSLFQSVPLRSEMIYLKNGVKIISDAYNANPSSMAAALQMLAAMGKEEQRKTVAILGDMLELGQSSKTAHFRMGQAAGKLKIDRILLYGVESENIRRGAIEEGTPRESVRVYPSHEALAEEVQKYFPERPLVLIKGSRGMKMEKVLAFLKQD